jgi:hypothetical protein
MARCRITAARRRGGVRRSVTSASRRHRGRALRPGSLRVMLADRCQTPAKITRKAGLDVTQHTDTPPPLMTGRYVALGSSMAAGPGIRPRAPGAPWPAFRSARNYAHLVADALGLDLVDVTYTKRDDRQRAGRDAARRTATDQRDGRFRVLGHRDDRRQRRGLSLLTAAYLPRARILFVDYLTLLRHPASTRHRCRSQTLMWAATSPKRSNATPPRPPRQRDVRS